MNRGLLTLMLLASLISAAQAQIILTVQGAHGMPGVHCCPSSFDALRSRRASQKITRTVRPPLESSEVAVHRQKEAERR